MKYFLSIFLVMFMALPFLIDRSGAQTVAALDLQDSKLREKVQYTSFIASKPLPSWGTIVGTKDAAVNLSEAEIVYIQVESARDVKAGDRFAILHRAQEVTHPQTQKKVGHLMVVSGELLVLTSQQGMATARIEKSFRSVLLGDMIVPPPKSPAESIPIRPMKKLEGMVLLSMEGSQNITQKELIFIDRGSYHGVIVGDRFSIYQSAHFPAEVVQKEKGRLPMPKVGEGVVISVQDESATALIVKSSQAIYVGDKIISGGE